MGDFMKIEILIRKVRLAKNITLDTLAKTSGMGSDDAKKTTKEIRDRNAAIRWYNDHIK